MIKYSSNVMLAARLAVMNELAEMAESVGGDIRDVAAGVGLDSRIGKSFLKAGPGFGGSCFGKDVSGIVKTAAYHGVDLSLVNEILNSNDRQRVRPAVKLERALGSLREKKGYTCTEKLEDSLRKADALIILTEWDEYRELEPNALESLMKGRVIVDTRNILDEKKFTESGFNVLGTGRSADAPKTYSRSRKEFVNAAIVVG